MSADSLAQLEELERRGNIGFEFGAQARQLLEDGHPLENVILWATHNTTVRSLAGLPLDHPGKVFAVDESARRLVMAEARRRAAAARARKASPTPVTAVVVAVSAQPRAREARSRRLAGTRASPGDDPDPLPERRCAYCERPLRGKRPQAKTCSGSCRVLLHRRRTRERAQS